jgi:predicted trehalose synthase
MLVSLENVGHVVHHGAGAADDPQLAAGVRAWTGQAQRRFLSAYREALGRRLDLFESVLVPAYEWEQVCREIVYAGQHDFVEWLYVPAAALRRRLAPER